jgi:beta-lactamase regulating signal transducer with metallopeptidase domain
MNTIDTVFEWLLAATLRASVLVVAVLFIRMIVRRWLSAGWRHALWLPMLAVLVIPVLPEASFGLFPKAAEQPTTASEVFVSSSGSTETSISAMPAPEVEAEMKTASPINVAAPVNYFAIAWLVGACGVLAAGIIGYRQNMLRIRTNAITPDRMLQASIDEAAREVGLKRTPQTLISSSVASPAVTGFIRPILLLPAGFPEGFSASEVRLILLHELTHLKRLDLQLNWLVCVLQAAHWFNPLLWFAFARMRADREAACDASVLSIDAKDYRAEYGSALLKLECVAPSRMLSLGFVGIFERDSEIKSRIKEISAHRPNRFLWQAVGGSIVTLLMVFGITKGQEAKPQEVAAAPAELKVDEATVEIQNKLNSIIIPRIDFEDRTLQESIDYLRLRAAALDEKELDPAKKGLNFVILNPNEGAAAIKIDELKLRNVPLSTVLKLMCDKIHYRYSVENFSIVLAPDMDPENATAKTELAYLDDPIRTNPALTHGHVKKVDQVRRTLYMAQGYYDLGKYDLAKKEYEDVLRIDPHNEAARRGMEKIAQSKSDCYRAAYGQTRAELLMQVDQAWELSIPADVPTLDPVTTRGPGQTDGVVAINAKLRNIIIPRIDFEDRTVEEAIDYLRLRAGELDVSELDPAKKGVNLVIRRPKSSLGGGLVPAEGELPAGEDLLGGGGDLGAARIDELRLRNVPLDVALKYICDKTNYRYKVRNQVVVLSPIN